MRDIIRESQGRCAQYGIETEQVYSNQMIGGDALMARIIANRDLIVTAEPFMNQLYDFVRGSNFIAILTDAQGCILSMIGDSEILETAHDMKMIPGAFMSEEGIGTNAMGTALHLGKPVQVSGREHLISAYYTWTCSCAVIRSADGATIIGALDLTGYIENSHPHTLGMVVAAVHAIENTMKLRVQNRLIAEQTTLSQRLMSTMKEGVLICDNKGSIALANERAISYFGMSQQDLERQPLWRILDRFEEMMISCRAGAAFVEEEMKVLCDSRLANLTVTATPVNQEDGSLHMVILKMSDAKRPRKLSADIASSRAIYTFDKIIGQSQRLKELINFAEQVADSSSTVLITGESGTGKEIFAHAIHNHSHRRQKPFVVVNCASIPANLIESELFGYEEGAFTGAKKGGSAGKFEIANGGTLFLDEIGEMPMAMQTRLLRVIQEGIVCRVGGHKQMCVDVRLIAATHKHLEQAVEKGRFRLDLFYRLNVLPLYLPSLNERKDDIPLLVTYFNRKVSKSLNRKPYQLSAQELDRLMAYSWPGNIRELENTVEYLVNAREFPPELLSYGPDSGGTKPTASAKGAAQDPMDSPLQGAMPTKDWSQVDLTLTAAEHRHIAHVLKLSNDNYTVAARHLGIARNTLYRKVLSLSAVPSAVPSAGLSRDPSGPTSGPVDSQEDGVT